MTAKSTTRLADILRTQQEPILQAWIKQQFSGDSARLNASRDDETRQQSKEFVELLREAAQHGEADTSKPAWETVRAFLTRLSAARVKQGFSSSDTAAFIFSLKLPLFDQLRGVCKDAQSFADEVWFTTQALDKLGLYSIEAFQKVREEVIQRQHQELLELSTPVIKLWDGILALPMIGTLDSARTQVVMETLLERIVETESPIVIIDITGVPTVDTLVAQHLLKTVSAARLMGTECIISGIRPQIAQTIVHLGVELGNVLTRATLADAIVVALKKNNLAVCPIQQKKPVETAHNEQD